MQSMRCHSAVRHLVGRRRSECYEHILKKVVKVEGMLNLDKSPGVPEIVGVSAVSKAGACSG